MRLIIISGRSGSGKSGALNLLADIGFNCIDNLPIELIPELVEHGSQEDRNEKQIAVCIDSRNPASALEHFGEVVAKLPSDVRLEIIYLDAAVDILIKRFSETRRRHPLTSPQLSLAEAIEQEETLLEPLKTAADLVVDTSKYSIHQLRDFLRQRVGDSSNASISIMFESFGFKYGAPVDADFIFDVRCLPNPYWEPSLRAFSGLETPVQEYLGAQTEVQEMYDDIRNFMERWLPRFAAENRSYVTIAIGCTGGKHRSVFLTERLSQHFRKNGGSILTRHRELSL